MNWVLDSSITLAWCFEDEATPATDAMLRHLAVSSAVVPQIWPLEVANVLVIASRKGRISRAERQRFLSMSDLQDISIYQHTHSMAFFGILATAEAYGLTIYDAAYLELASSRNIPLATLDAKLASAAKAAGVPLL